MARVARRHRWVLGGCAFFLNADKRQFDPGMRLFLSFRSVNSSFGASRRRCPSVSGSSFWAMRGSRFSVRKVTVTRSCDFYLTKII